MQTTLFFLQQHLRNTIRLAAEKAHEQQFSTDPFQAELARALHWFSFTLPQQLPLDGITRQAVLPYATDFRLQATSPAKWTRKPQHPLIKEIKGGKLLLRQVLKHTAKPDESLSSISKLQTGGRATVSELMRWNEVDEESLEAGHELWLVNPEDVLVKDLASLAGSFSLEGKLPLVPIRQLSPAVANKYLKPEERQYDLLVKLSFRGDMLDVLNALLLAADKPCWGKYISPAAAKAVMQRQVAARPGKLSEVPYSLLPAAADLRSEAKLAGGATESRSQQGTALAQEWELVMACRLNSGGFVRANSSHQRSAPSAQAGAVSLVLRQLRGNSHEQTRPDRCGYSIGRSLLEGWSESSLALDAEARVLLLRSSTAIGEVAAIAIAPGGVSLEEAAGAVVREKVEGNVEIGSSNATKQDKNKAKRNLEKESNTAKSPVDVNKFNENTSEQEIISLTSLKGEGLEKRKISQELYDKLRKKTPTKKIREMVNKGKKPPYPDQALPGRTVTSNLQADHIVPMDKIVRMDGFDKLTQEQQLTVLNNPENFVGLSEAANKSKGPKSFSEWTEHKGSNTKVDPNFRERMIQLENELEVRLQQQISSLLSSN